MLFCTDPSPFYAGVLMIMLGASVAILWRGRLAFGLAMALSVSGMLVVSESKAEAAVSHEEWCRILNEQQVSCWTIWLSGCWCTWDDEQEEGGGGGSGAGYYPQ